MKKRIITAAILIAITVPLIYLGGWWTVGFVAVAIMGGIVEILKAAKEKKWNPAVYIVTIAGSLGIFLWWFIICYVNGDTKLLEIPNPYIVRVNVVYLAAFLIALLSIEVTTKNFMMDDVFYLFTMSFLICVGGQGVIFIRQELGLVVFIYIVFCTYMCDTFALVFGRLFGKHKFAPITSPKKTWEGVIGGVAMATILGFVFTLIFPLRATDNWVFIPLSFVLGVGAVWGDLIFSSIKRHMGIKDFGTLLPGHGGILDRIDSLLFNILVYISAFGFITMGVFK